MFVKPKFVLLLIFLSILIACQSPPIEPDITSVPVDTRLSVTPVFMDTSPSRTPPPITDFISRPTLDFGITWAGRGLGADGVFYVNTDGTYWFSFIDPGGASRGRDGTLSVEIIENINGYKERLRELSPLPKMEGQFAVNIYLNDEKPFTFTCGNRDCPVVVRELAWDAMMPMGSHGLLLFNDEAYIQGGIESRTNQLAWFSWFDDLKTPPRILVLREGNLLEFYQLPYSTRQLYEYWYINDSEMAEVVSCLTSLEFVEDSTSGNDVDVLKLNYWPVDQDGLRRLSKADPPDCLPGMMTLLQESLSRERPQAYLSIRPFD